MITQRCRYALKAMLNLARADPSQPKQVRAISEEEHIPRKFLEAIMSDMRQSGLVESSRGKTGGYALSRPAELITFGEVMRQVDGPLALLGCVSHKFYQRCEDCDDEKTCDLRRVMATVRKQVSDILDRTTLSDAVEKRAALLVSDLIEAAS
jgi:Rrf2 family protein